MKHKATAIEDMRELIERKLALLLAQNPTRMNYDIKYREIVAAYNLDKDRPTIEATFARMLEVVQGLDEEQHRAEVESVILDRVFLLPEPPYTPDDKDAMAKMLYEHVWQQSMAGSLGTEALQAGQPVVA